MTEPQGPRDQECCPAEGPERGMGVSEGLEGQGEGLCSASILHLNQAGLQCGEAGQGLTPAPSLALYTRANHKCGRVCVHICTHTGVSVWARPANLLRAPIPGSHPIDPGRAGFLTGQHWLGGAASAPWRWKGGAAVVVVTAAR